MVEKVVKNNTTQAVVEAQIVEKVGFTNNLQDFWYQIHGNYWFQGRKHSKNLGQGGGYHMYIYMYTHICMVFKP